MSTSTLFLASTSPSRRLLLEQAQIPFTVIGQTASEEVDINAKTISEVVREISFQKIEHAQMPAGTGNGQVAFVLVADTLTEACNGTILAKPVDRTDAHAMLGMLREGNATVATGYVLDKRQWDGTQWHTVERSADVVVSTLYFLVPPAEVDLYLDNAGAMGGSAGLIIEGFGSRYVQQFQGSYTAVMGLPVAQVYKTLCAMGFFALVR